jgi:hypothetical protein
MSLRKIFEARFDSGPHSYVTTISEDLQISWRPLSIGEYIYYADLTVSKAIPPAVIEDEIFRKCVTNESVLRQMDFFPAGIISTVAQNIWMCSGPREKESVNEDLNAARFLVDEGPSAVLHNFVDTIIKAFPAYTHEQVYSMDYETLVIRVVQAEKRLLTLGLMNEPIHVFSKEELEEVNKKRQRPAVDAKALYDQQQRNKPKAKKEVKKDKWWEVSPILEATKKEKIDFKEETKEIAFAVGWDQVDMEIARRKMVEEARKTYAPVIKELEKKKQIRKK